MAKSVTRSTIRTAVRNRGDWQSTVYPTDTEINTEINSSVCAFWEEVIPLEHVRSISTSNVTVVADTDTYPLTSVTDFYKLMGVEVADGQSQTGYFEIYPYNWNERNDQDFSPTNDKSGTVYQLVGSALVLHPIPKWSGTIRLRYVPTAPQYSNDSGTIDFYNHGDEWVTLDVVCKMAMKEADITTYQIASAERDKVLERIKAFTKMDIGRVPCVTDPYRPYRFRNNLFNRRWF